MDMKWGIALVLVVGALTWSLWIEQIAENNAKEFCDTVTIGSSFAEITDTAMTVGEDHLRFIREDSIIIGFTGIPPFSRHSCEVRGKEGKVESKEYIYVD